MNALTTGGLPGELGGKYRLLLELGYGGMAEVYLALASGPSRARKLCVLKLMRRNLMEDHEFREMFLEEARLAMRLNHPNIVNTFEVGDEQGRYFIAMEFLEGQSLHTVVSPAGSESRRTLASPPVSGPPPERLSLAGHLRVLIDVGYGLQYAYDLRDLDGSALNIVHRDISPHNVFITYDGQVKILDFGIAKAAGSAVQTSTGVVKGKLTYMAPEQANGRVVDNRADVYSLGIMLWEAIAGRRRYKDATNVEVQYLHAVSEKPPLCGAVELGLPALAEEIVQRAIDPIPRNRFASAGEMVAALEDLAKQIGPPLSNRELAGWLSARFQREREDLRARMEATVKEPVEGVPSGERATLRPPARTGNTPVYDAGARRAGPDSETVSASSLVPKSGPRAANANAEERGRESTATGPTAAIRGVAANEPAAPPSPRKGARRLLGGGIVVGAVALALVVARRGPTVRRETAVVSATTASHADAPAPPTLPSPPPATPPVSLPAGAAAGPEPGAFDAGVSGKTVEERPVSPRSSAARRSGRVSSKPPPVPEAPARADGPAAPLSAAAPPTERPPAGSEVKLDRVDPWNR